MISELDNKGVVGYFYIYPNNIIAKTLKIVAISFYEMIILRVFVVRELQTGYEESEIDDSLSLWCFTANWH